MIAGGSVVDPEVMNTILVASGVKMSSRVIAYLVRNGAAVNVRNRHGTTRCTPLMMACNRLRLDIARDLLGAGAQVGAQDISGKSAIQYLSMTLHNCTDLGVVIDLIELLVRHGADSSAIYNDCPSVRHTLDTHLPGK